MTIEAIVRRSRLYSCISTDPKPEGWAPGILLLETDTGVWWYTDDQRQWQLCYVPAAESVALATLVAATNTELAATKTRLAALERFLSPPQAGR